MEEVVLPSILEEIDDDLASLLQSPQSNLPSTEAECIPTKSATNSDIQVQLGINVVHSRLDS